MNYISVTELGKRHGCSGIAMNRILARYGLQYKQNGAWILTKEGAKYSKVKTPEFPDSIILWNENTLYDAHMRKPMMASIIGITI
ncbi:MAG: hypothetical protein HQK59_01805 [Deltaproteobacteria bacterium]|nr:hypothetical protein [Deltaproteobacteria bacterium]